MTARKCYIYKRLIKCRTILMRMKTGFARGWNRLNKESPTIFLGGGSSSKGALEEVFHRFLFENDSNMLKTEIVKEKLMARK